MNDIRDTDHDELDTEVDNELTPPSSRAPTDLPPVSMIPKSVLEYILDEIRGLRADAASETPPTWALRLFDALQSVTAKNSTLEAKYENAIARLQRLPCWAATRDVDCPLEVVEGGKAE
jgi:hypothetical protein